MRWISQIERGVRDISLQISVSQVLPIAWTRILS